MRRRIRKRTLIGGGLLLFVAVIAAITLAPDFGNNSARAVPTATLNRIATKNDRAADAASADLRNRSAESAAAADARRDAEDNGAASPSRFTGNAATGAPPAPAR